MLLRGPDKAIPASMRRLLRLSIDAVRLDHRLAVTNVHYTNLILRAAYQTMRISNMPCFQREMLVEPYVRSR